MSKNLRGFQKPPGNPLPMLLYMSAKISACHFYYNNQSLCMYIASYSIWISNHFHVTISCKWMWSWTILLSLHCRDCVTCTYVLLNTDTQNVCCEPLCLVSVAIYIAICLQFLSYCTYNIVGIYLIITMGNYK